MNNTSTLYRYDQLSNNSQLTSAVAMVPTSAIVVYISLISIIMVVAVVGNCVVIVVETLNKAKTSTDWLVLFMSVDDLIMSMCVIPFYIIIHSGKWSVLGSSAMCRVVKFVEITMSYSSTLLLSVTAIDRFIKTCHPHCVGITPKRSKYVCIGLTTLTSLIGSPMFVNQMFDKVSYCKYVPKDSTMLVFIQVLIYTVQLSYFLMFVVVVVCYCRIGYIIRTRLRRTINAGTVHDKKQAYPKGNATCSTHVSKQTSSNCLIKPSNKVAPLNSNLLTANTQAVSTKESNERNNQCDDVVRESIAEPTPQSLELISSDLNPNKDHLRHSSSTEDTYPPSVTTSIEFTSVNSAQDRRTNRTTAIMFAITLVFILTWIPPWVVGAILPKNLSDTALGNTIIMFTRRTFIINTCTNPLFFIGMSSVFRKKTKQVLRQLWKYITAGIHP